MIQVEIYNNFSSIKDLSTFDRKLPIHISKALYEKLSYMNPQAEWSPKYKQGLWDGRISIYNKRTQCFPTGLCSRVRDLFKELSLEFEFVDKRNKPEKNYPIECDFGGKELRFYQNDAANLALKCQRGMLSLATGAGKTLTSCQIFSNLGVAPVLFVVPAIELLKQTQKEFEKILKINGEPVKVGIAGDGICDLNMEGVNVITYQTALAAFNKKYSETQYKVVEDTKNDDGTSKSTEQLKTEYEDALKAFKSNETSKPLQTKLKKAETSYNNRLKSIQNKQKIKTLIESVKALVIDEAHVAPVVIEEIALPAKNAYYRIGMSVDATSKIELKGEVFGSGFIGTIEEAFNILSDNGYEIKQADGYECVLLSDVKSRGWTGTNFDWKNVKTFIRHKNDKLSRWLKVGGTKIGFTDDHSVFVAEQNEKLELIEKNTADVNVGDIMAYDNGLNWNNIECSEDDYYQILMNSDLNPKKIRVVVNLSNITKEDLNISYKAFWALKKTKYGHSVNLSQYMKLRDKLPKPTLIYTERSNNISFDPNIKMSDLAYLLGFYIGDGWIDKNKISFAVENSFVNQFMNYLNNIKGVVFNPSIRDMKQGSVEIHINHCVLAALFKHYFKKAKCYDKKIPADWILNWDEISRRNLLTGMLDSDGHYSVRGTKRTFYYTTTSKKLVDDLACLTRSLNIMSGLSVSKPRPGGIVNGRRILGNFDKYQLYFSANSLEGINSGHKGKSTRFKHNFDDFTEARVKEIIIQPISDFVYDLEMEGHPSFVVNGVLCHNSATPFRTDNQEIRIEGILGKKITETSCSDLIELGFLVPPKVFACPIKKIEDSNTYQETYTNNIVNHWERNYRIKQFAEALKEDGRPTLILVERLEHGNILEGMIEDAVFVPGGDKGEIDPSDEEKNYRRRMLNAVENNEIILIATQWANVGVDAPKISALILAGSSSSPVTTIQQAGRILRCVGKDIEASKSNGKSDAVIIDFSPLQKHLRAHYLMRKRVYLNERAWYFEELK
jgi:superfamily II DNA or RNA helicase/intein/homing endonuclease